MIGKNTFFQRKTSLNLQGQLLDLSVPRVMGILNLTPDSFFDGGKYVDETAILQQVEKMLSEGADIIDVGAYSSRPHATDISEEEEQKRLIPALQSIIRYFPKVLLSVDTFRSEIARAAIAEGACMINDISGGEADPAMFSTVAALNVPYVLMHMQGNPQTMQNNPVYKNIVEELCLFFSKKISALKEQGIHDIIIDPGFGFGKTVEHNFELLNRLDDFKLLESPVLAGISRKSMIYRPLKTSADKALNGTTALNTIAILKGADLLRVHDVKEAKEVITLSEELKKHSGAFN